MNHDPASLAALELPSLRRLLAELAATDLGRERMTRLAPAEDLAELELRRRAFEEVADLLRPPLVPQLEDPVQPLLDRLADPRVPLTGKDLLGLAAVLEASSSAVERLATADIPRPLLGAVARGLPDLSEPAARVRRQLDPRGEVRDDATPTLARLRREVRGQRDRLYQQLQGYRDAHRDQLADDTVPVRDGRLVLVVSAGASGRLDGLVHGRSGTGRSAYFEPLEVVEGNNRLTDLQAEEAAERRRVLAELEAALRSERDGVEAHAEFLARLDGLQSAHRFAGLAAARLADLAPPATLELRAARHPLLDPALADLRLAALGQTGHQGVIVPLDLSLSPTTRALVVTGPNAGGKTVALKTVGLLCLAHLCGLPVPAAAGTRLPWLERLVATIGDDQDLLADRSTFSGRLVRLKDAWAAAGPDSLILLDELGSGTDPQEGAALAGALLAGLVDRGGLALMTTHLGPLAAEALESPGAECAAMDLDPETGEPRYRLLPGPPGGSEALRLAERLGLDSDLLAEARRRLGPEGRDYRRLLAEVTSLRERVAAALASAETDREAAAGERRRVELERERLAGERAGVKQQLGRELEAFRREVRQRLGREVERLAGELERGRRRGLAAEATRVLFEAAPDLAEAEQAGSGELEVSGLVRHRSLGWEGVLERLDRGRAEVRVRGKTLRCPAEALVAVGPDPRAKPPARPSVPTPTAPATPHLPSELGLIGDRVEPALERLDAYLDQALLAGRDEVRVVHGHGSGRLREAVRRHLRSHLAVASWRPGQAGEGGNGATVVTLAGGDRPAAPPVD